MPVILLEVTVHDVFELSDIQKAPDLGLNMNVVLISPVLYRSIGFDDKSRVISVPSDCGFATNVTHGLGREMVRC